MSKKIVNFAKLFKNSTQRPKMTQKKLMLLGGIRYLLPVIETAHSYGCHVVTVDYMPSNIAHKYSDEYHNVSIVVREAVLQLAQRLNIDGILSFAVDPGVVSASYVAEQMRLPFTCSFHAACILQDKALFRQFLTEHGFNVPKAKGYSDIAEAIGDKDRFNWPVIVKPVDSAGSKGVSRVDHPNDLEPALRHALSESHSGNFIIEDYLEKEGPSSGSESFFVDGKLLYNGFYDQYFDNDAANPYTPSAEIWPSMHDSHHLEEVKRELQRLGDLLHFGTGLFNVEWRLCKDGKVYLMEVSPRAGGNRLAEMLNHAADVDLIDAEVRKAIGLPVSDVHEPHYKGIYAIYVLHSKKTGRYAGLEISDSFDGEIIETEVRVSPGDKVEPFKGANDSIGTLFIRFRDREQMERCLCDIQRTVIIKTIPYE